MQHTESTMPDPTTRKASMRLPWGLLCCWVLGAYLIVCAIYGAWGYAERWDFIHAEMVYHPEYNFLPLYMVAICKLVAGILLVTRSKWALPVLAITLAFFLYYILAGSPGGSLSGLTLLYVGQELSIMLVSLQLFIRGRLR